MDQIKAFQQNRRARQFLMAVIFLTVIVTGWYYPLFGFFIPLCMLLGVFIGLSRGRKWCDWYCPRGSFYDSLMYSVSPKKDMPEFVKDLRFRIGILVSLMLVMLVNLVLRWPDLNRIGAFFVLLLSVTTIIGVILSLFFHHRMWCMVCPVGTIINLIGRKKYPLKINSRLCVECRLCRNICPVQISPYKHKKEGEQIVSEGDCLKCDLCVHICPKKALKRDANNKNNS